jgi:hypothetical protein
MDSNITHSLNKIDIENSIQINEIYYALERTERNKSNSALGNSVVYCDLEKHEN